MIDGVVTGLNYFCVSPVKSKRRQNAYSRQTIQGEVPMSDAVWDLVRLGQQEGLFGTKTCDLGISEAALTIFEGVEKRGKGGEMVV